MKKFSKANIFTLVLFAVDIICLILQIFIGDIAMAIFYAASTALFLTFFCQAFLTRKKLNDTYANDHFEYSLEENKIRSRELKEQKLHITLRQILYIFLVFLLIYEFIMSIIWIAAR